MQPAGQPKTALREGEQCRVVELMCSSTSLAGLQVLAGSRPHEVLQGPAGVAMRSPPGDAAGGITAAPIAWWLPQVQSCVAAGPVAVFEVLAAGPAVLRRVSASSACQQST